MAALCAIVPSMGHSVDLNHLEGPPPTSSNVHFGPFWTLADLLMDETLVPAGCPRADLESGQLKNQRLYNYKVFHIGTGTAVKVPVLHYRYLYIQQNLYL